MKVANADGSITHDGCYNPWETLDKEKEKAARDSGGFVMRTGHVNIQTGMHYNDGLLYVIINHSKPQENQPSNERGSGN